MWIRKLHVRKENSSKHYRRTRMRMSKQNRHNYKEKEMVARNKTKCQAYPLDVKSPGFSMMKDVEELNAVCK